MVKEKELLKLYEERFELYEEKKEFMRFFCFIFKIHCSSGNVLDIGCGPGFFLKELEGKYYETYGLDISQKAIEEAGKFTNAELRVGDVGEKLPFKDEFFDGIVMADVIEYPEDYEKTLREVNRITKPGGILFIVALNSSSILHYIQGKNWSWYKDQYHIHMFNEKEMESSLEKAGFAVISMKTFFNFYTAGETTKIFKLMRRFKKIVYAPKIGDSMLVIAKKI